MKILAALLFGAMLIAFGWSLAVYGLVVIGGLYLGFGVIMIGTYVVGIAFRAKLADPTAGFPRATLYEGEPATHVARARWMPHLLAPYPLVGGLACLAGAVRLPPAGNELLAVLLGATGLWLLTFPLWVATGRWVAGGYWLTPTRVVQRWGPVWWSVRYDDILRVRRLEEMVGIKATCWEHRRFTPTFRNRRALPFLGKRARFFNLGLDPGSIILDASVLSSLIHELVRDPSARREAGTHRLLGRIERLRQEARESAAYWALKPAERRAEDRKREERRDQFVREMEARFAAEAAADQAPDAGTTTPGPE